MSFSQDVKNELMKIVPVEPHCIRSELLAFLYSQSEEPFDETVPRKSCCRRAFLRGAFLSCGSISDPEKSYHLEMVFGNETAADLAVSFLGDFSVEAKKVVRNHKYVV